MSDVEATDQIYSFSVALSLVGFECDPDDITEHLDLEPTRVVRRGEPRRSGMAAKYNVWSFEPPRPAESSPPHHIEVESVLRPFRDALESRLEKVATLPACGMKTLSIYVAPCSVTPSFGFDPESLAFLGRLGLPFEIDIQNYGPEDEKDTR